MANSGTFYTSGYPNDGSGAPYRFKFSWSLTGQSIEGNYSTISWSVVCNGGRTSNYFIYIYEKYVTVNGSSQSRNYEEKIYSGTTVFSGSATIYHSADGSGSFAANCGGSFYSSGSYNSSGSGSWVLPTIPRSCSIDKIGNITGAGISSINTGNDIRIYFTPKTTSFSYRTTVSIGSNSSTNIGTVSNTNQTYRQYNIPHNWLPNGTSGTLTCKLETLNGSTVIGTSTKTITINVGSSVIPTTSGIVATYVSAGNSVVDSWGIYVQNKSKVKITLNGVTPGSGSSIKSCTAIMYATGASAPMSISGSTATYTTGVLSSSGTLTYVAYATDNRGRNSTARSVNITCYPYSNISISSLRVDRCLANGTISQDGKYAKCTFSGSCASVNGKNKVDSSSSKFYYKEKGASTWTALSTVNSVSGVSIVGGNFDISKEYEIRLIVKDLVGSSATVYGKLDTAERVFNIAKYGNGLAVGKVSTVSNKSADGKFECGWDASFDKSVSVNGKTLIDLIYPVGSIYMSVNNVSPQAFFGGTWEQIQNRFLLAAGSSYAAGSTGGEATHTLTVDEMPAHKGHMYDNFNDSGWVDRGGDTNSYYLNSTGAAGYGEYENRPYKVVSGNELVMQGFTRGGGEAHNNMPPYLSVFMWKRTK